MSLLKMQINKEGIRREDERVILKADESDKVDDSREEQHL